MQWPRAPEVEVHRLLTEEAVHVKGEKRTTHKRCVQARACGV